jgi:hypothetical protein
MFYKKGGVYVATLNHNGKTLHLGGKQTPSECVKLRKAAISRLQEMRAQL